MPFEVWKTRMGRYRSESTVQAFKAVYERGGGGMKGAFLLCPRIELDHRRLQRTTAGTAGRLREGQWGEGAVPGPHHTTSQFPSAPTPHTVRIARGPAVCET